MNTGPTATPPAHEAAQIPGAPRRLRERLVVLLILAATAALVLVLVLVLVLGRELFMDDNASPAPASAAQSRAELNRVLDESAAVGLTVTRTDPRYAPLTCTLPDGKDGYSYFLQELDGPPVDDIAALFAGLAAEWRARGYDVRQGAAGNASRVSASTPDGGVVYALAGPAGTVLAGESACATEPGPEPTDWTD